MNPFFALLATAAIGLPLSAAAEPGNLLSGSVPLHFTDDGAGETVVLLHSFAGSSAMWHAVGLAPLDGFRTIAFDARGHGESGKPESANVYGQEMVGDVIRLMDARGIDRAHIVGYSMGAETALKLASDYPDRVLSLVVAGSGWSGEAESETYGFIAGALSGVASFGDFMAAMAPEDVPEAAAAAALVTLAAHGIVPDQDAAPLAAVAGAMPELIELDAETLGTITVPVLGLAGEFDPERANVEKLAEALPDFHFVMIPGADHLAAPLAPDFATAVTDFLRH